MRTLYLDRKGARLGWRNGALEMRLPDEPLRRIPLRDLERIVLAAPADITTGTLNGLWERGIALLILTGGRGEAGARFEGAPHNDARIRLRQIATIADPARRLEWAGQLVRFRLRQMRRVGIALARRRQRGRDILEPALAAITGAERRLAATPPASLDLLRGIEGAVLASWFAGYARLFPPSLGFAARRRRPPPDPVNAALSLGYTLATAEAAREASQAGFDLAAGLIHGLAHGREALALDLVEPARPHVDRMVHDLFHSRRLTDRHASRTADGAVLLGKAGRATFYQAWETEAAPVIRPLLRGLCRHAVRALRRGPASPAEQASATARSPEDADDP
jgi:CRISPR-associated protein Cas1